MKISKHYRQKQNWIKIPSTLIALALLFFVSSCSPKHSGSDEQPEPQSGIFFLHAAPGVGGMNVSLNDTKLNSDETLSYTKTFGLNVIPNNYEIQFTHPVSGNVVAEAADSLQGGYIYTAVLYDTASSVNLMLFKNLFEETDQTTGSFVNFLNLDPDNPSVTIKVDGEDVFLNRTYADNVTNPDLAKYKVLSPGTYSIKAFDADGELIDEVEDATLELGGAHVLYLSGYEDADKEDLEPKLHFFRAF